MYARRLSGKLKATRHVIRSSQREHLQCMSCSKIDLLGDKRWKFVTNPFLLPGGATRSNYTDREFNSGWKRSGLRFYSSKGDGTNANNDKHVTAKDAAELDKGKAEWQVKTDARLCDAHARLGEKDQRAWMKNEKLSFESKKKDSPFLSRRERFKNDFLQRVVPWEKITVSWDTFPYYIHDHTKNLLVECAASHLKQKKFTESYGARLPSSSGRILLQSIPGTELYRERSVRALAQNLQVPLLVLDSSVLAPYDFGEECASETDTDEDNAESAEESTSESDDDVNDTSNEEGWTSGSEAKSDSEVDVAATAEAALKKLVPHELEEFEKRVSGEESESTSKTEKTENVQSPTQSKRPLRKGDRVKYVEPSKHIEADNRIRLGKIPTSDGPTIAYTIINDRSFPRGQRGEVYEVNGDQVAVIMDKSEKKTKGEADEEITEEVSKPSIHWTHIDNIEHDLDSQAEDWCIAMEALHEVLSSLGPVIVYFPDSSQWLSRAVPKSNRQEFVRKVEEMFNQLSGPVVLICGQNKVEEGSKEKEKFTMVLPNFGRLGKLVITSIT